MQQQPPNKYYTLVVFPQTGKHSSILLNPLWFDLLAETGTRVLHNFLVVLFFHELRVILVVGSGCRGERIPHLGTTVVVDVVLFFVLFGGSGRGGHSGLVLLRLVLFVLVLEGLQEARVGIALEADETVV